MLRMLQTLFVFIVCCIGFTQSAMASDAQIKQVRVNNTAEFSQLIFDLTDKIEYHSFSLQNPDRLVIDIPSAKVDFSVKNIPKQVEFIKDFRVGYQHDSYVRFVIDLVRPMTSKILLLPSDAKNPYRLVVEFPPTKAAFVSNESSHVEVKVPVKKTVKTMQSSDSTRDIIVVIDPGHGGKDPGAVGINGAHEKIVTLQIAERLQKLINKEPGFKAILTRTTDVYIGLRQRLTLAHKHKADLFVAIHADAYRHQYAHGASVYALSERGATSEAARWLAKKENESEFVGGLDLADKDHLLRSVLIDLSQTQSISASLQMGSEILHQLSKYAELHHPAVEQAAFVVLKSPDIPSLLIETGFISNPTEEKNLTDPLYQEQIATQMMQGIKGYFISHPPRGTQLAHVNQHHQLDSSTSEEA